MTATVVVQLLIQKGRVEDEVGGHRWLTNVIALLVVDILLAGVLCFERTCRSAKGARLALLGLYIGCVMLHPLLPISSDPADFKLL